MSSPDNPGGDPNIRAHRAGETVGKVIGGGLGVVVGFVLLVLLFGPVLWAPLWAGLRVARLAVGPWQPWVAGTAAFIGAALLLAWLLIQRSPLLRYPIVTLCASAWVGGLWLEFSSPPHDWVTTAPTLSVPGPWTWAVIGVATVIYAGLYLLALNSVARGPWARRWQLIKLSRSDGG